MGWAQLGGPHKLELLGKISRTAVHFFLVFDIKLFIDIQNKGVLISQRRFLFILCTLFLVGGHQVRLSTHDGTGRRQWISQQCRSILRPERLNITKVSLDDNLSARAWGYCPFPECKAKTLCRLRWKADQVVLTCFRNNVHHHKEIPGSHRSAQKKVADTVAYNSPLRASAALLGRMPALRPCDQPSDKEHRRARRRF